MCSQCGGNLFNKLPDGNYQCLYCQSIILPEDASTTILTDTSTLIINTSEYEDPELAELCQMELDDMRTRFSIETDENQKANLLLKIKDLENELIEMKSK